ncbi:MAG: hypothetical protein LUD03_05730 [Firmicutes bacterium]|nr:hypothetical protein [Bacillota bacterium]
MKVTDLSGEWRYETDENNVGIREKFYQRDLKNGGFSLPGSTCDNKIGERCKAFSYLSRESVRSLVPKYNYIGALWLEREIETEDLTGKSVKLFLERVNIASRLWIDGKSVGREIIELSAPHIYDLSGVLTAGRHRITLRIDNSNLLNIDGMASGYSADTQSIWLGIIGRIELWEENVFNIASVRLYPDVKSVFAEITLDSDCKKPDDRRAAKLTLDVTAPNGERLKPVKHSAVLYNRRQVERVEYPMGKNIEYWDEFNPALYTMKVTYECGGVTDVKSEIFGMRTVEVKGKEFILNGHPISLRGTVDCAIYPDTGYPPTDLNEWLTVMRRVKEYGLNHIRFHAWCPPNNAFLAADITGVYVLAEMPLWLNEDVCALDTGSDPIHRAYYTAEALNISRAYGNHPSFIMFSNGNELLGDFEMLEDITTQIKAVDDRRLYTLTSNFDHPLSPCEDYLCAFETYGHRVRLQVFHDVVSEHTKITYDDAVADTPAPVVSFEVGQYCVYPDVDGANDYTGNLVPLNFDVIKRSMVEKGVYHKLKKYVRASGKFAALMYKEDIEAALRTRKMGGFELLSLTDYTGQGTATIGLLDAFGKSKGIISPDEFRRFCSPTVPLFMAKRIFKNTEKLKAEFDIYNYSPTKILHPEYKFTLYDGTSVVYETVTKRPKISIPLDFITKPSQLTATLEVGMYKNSWTIFVYTGEKEKINVPILKKKKDILNIIENGGRAVVQMTADNLAAPIDGLFKPVFWSPAYFPSKRACGLIIDNAHPLFERFPTADTADFQWKHPIDNSVGCDISALPKDFEPIIEPVPNFFDNTPRSPLFEARVGRADLLFSGFDLSAKDTASAALTSAMAKYVNSGSFTPSQTLDAAVVIGLFK